MFENCKQNKNKKKTHTHTHKHEHILSTCHVTIMVIHECLHIPYLNCLVWFSLPIYLIACKFHLLGIWKLGAPNLQLVTLHSFQSSWKNLGNSIPMSQNKMSSINKGSKASFTRASFCASSFDCAMDLKQSIECLVGTQIQILKLTVLDLRLDRI